MISRHLEHDLFLLMVNLSQLKNSELILRTFTDAFNSSQTELTLLYSENSPSDNNENAIEIKTPFNRFGWIIFSPNQQTIPEEIFQLMTNSIQMLGLILENIKQRELLLNENLRLEELVELRTEAILKTEQDLQKSQKKYKHLFDSMLQGVVYQNILGQILEANQAAEKILGLSIDQMQGRKSIDARWRTIYEDGTEYKGEDHPAMIAIRTGKKIKDSMMGVYNPVENLFKWISIDAIPQFNENQEIAGVFATFNDITEKREAEAAYRRSEERFRIMFEEANIGIFICRNNSFLLANLAYAKIFGYNNPNELIGIPVTNMLATENKDMLIQRNINRESGKLEISKYDALGLKKNGSIFPFHIEISPIMLDDGEATLVFLTDITERKEMEDMLRESENRFRQIVDNAPDAIFIHTGSTFAYVNSKTLILFGAEVFSQLVGMNVFDRIHPDSHIVIKEKMNDLDKTKTRISNMELKYLTLIGSVIDVEASAVPFRFKNQDGALVFARDISERKKAEVERLRLQNLESLGILAGGIAHDFNNILVSILGRLSIVLEDFPEGESKQDLIKIESATQRAVGLTRQLLTFAKGGTPEKLLISLKKIIRETTLFALSGSNVDVEFTFNDTLPIEADPGQIAQVIQNIVINAKQAMPKGGYIYISSEDILYHEKDPGIKITFKDTGNGMPEENLQKIFNPYFTTKDTGSGLGLSVCHSIIRRHKGEIMVESEPDKGTTFTILLPATNQLLTESKKGEIYNIQSLTILIMDDDPEVRELLNAMLIKIGHSTIITTKGEEAIIQYNESRNNNIKIDLVFLDLTIRGGLGGIETLKQLKKIDPAVKSIVSSGYADSSISEYRKHGFNAKLDKPYTKEQVKQVIHQVMI